MCDFKPGDEVVCVDAGPLRGGHCSGLVEGRVYIVRKVSDYPTTDGTLSVYIDVRSRAGDGGWRSSRFRKAQRPNTDLSIESFLTIKPGFEEPRRPKAPAKKERA